MEFKTDKLVPLGIKVTEEQSRFLRSMRGYNRYIRFLIDDSDEFKKHLKEQKNGN